MPGASSGAICLRPDHLGLSRPGADSGLWEFLKLELMRTGGGCLGAEEGPSSQGPVLFSCLESFKFTLNCLCFYTC